MKKKTAGVLRSEEKKKIERKANSAHKTNSRSAGMAGKPSNQNKFNQELAIAGIGKPCGEKESARFSYYPRSIKSLSQLAQEFYWCDEQSFYQMNVPFREAKAFAEASFSSDLSNDSVFNFIERVRRAQAAAARYCAWITAQSRNDPLS